MRKMLGVITAASLFITRCGPSGAPAPAYKTPSKGSPQQAAATAGSGAPQAGSDILNSLPDSPEGKAALAKALDARNSSETKELNLLKKTNEKFCQRLDKLRSECAASVRIVGDSAEKILGCDGSYSGNTTVRHKFKVEFNGDGGQFTVVADKIFASNSFGSGSTALEFKSTANNDVAAPRLMDVTNLRLTPSAGSLPDIKAVQFSLVVDETTVFTQGNLIKGSDGNYFSINPQAVEEIRRSAACNVTDTELDGMVAAARQETAGSSN